MKIVEKGAYPAVMTLGIFLHYQLLNLGFGIQMATYTPVIIGALIITFLEIKFPHRKRWFAKTNDVINDSVYMLFVQVILPRILSFFVVITFLNYLNSNEFTIEIGWPHQWPIFAQAILMVLAADFLRYWLHLCSHKWSVLWRLHAVHHSPQKLYWLNVGRFHPIEKALQFLFDSLPFIILGVSEEVIAFYFVFYSINGFFQHCNIQLRLGFLNYVVSGPELHRWHHSKLIHEANNNYGNNFIIWDFLFGTRFLPEDKLVEELGLKNRAYPLGFLAQLKTPFIKGMDQG